MDGHYKKDLEFICCFCNKNIQENRTDPLDINIIFNEDMKLKTGSFQNFYAHFYCLKEKLHTNTKGYLVREDEE